MSSHSTPAQDGTAAAATVGRHETHRQVLRREFLAAALYMALVLLAGLVVVPTGYLPSDRTIVATMLGTAVGLVLAHWLAFRLASHVSDASGVWPGSAAQEAGAQVLGGLAVATAGAVPFLLLDGTTALRLSLLALGAMPAVVGLGIARSRGRSWLSSAFFAAAVLVLSLAVVLVKSLLGH
ncbi:hypothetical protein [Aquipuribacter sp. MA13-6]|uniref:hypothetical protein n=1 Tax=unclassified Aquipuribacter TaxID=2635084 RepID=UPI003EEB29CF